MSEPTVTYTVKEMLAQIHAKVDVAIGKIDNLEARVALMEVEREQKTRRGELRRWVVEAVCALVLAVGVVVGWFHG